MLNGEQLVSKARTIGDLYPVAYDLPGIAKIPRDTVSYRMYRNVLADGGGSYFRDAALRFDLSAMADISLGKEPNKTLGHYHPPAVRGLSYPEIYHVVHGEAVYLLQKKEEGMVTDFVVVRAKAGEALFIPPNYGHVTVNIGPGPLLMANLVSDRFTSIYSEYIAMGGAAYFFLKDGLLVRNVKYGELPEPRYAHPNFTIVKDLYTDFISSPASFAFLNHPREERPSL
jgi:glucose-6-phosphate isomerase